MLSLRTWIRTYKGYIRCRVLQLSLTIIYFFLNLFYLWGSKRSRGDYKVQRELPKTNKGLNVCRKLFLEYQPLSSWFGGIQNEGRVLWKNLHHGAHAEDHQWMVWGIYLWWSPHLGHNNQDIWVRMSSSFKSMTIGDGYGIVLERRTPTSRRTWMIFSFLFFCVNGLMIVPNLLQVNMHLWCCVDEGLNGVEVNNKYQVVFFNNISCKLKLKSHPT